MGGSRYKSESYYEFRNYIMELRPDNSGSRKRLLRNLSAAVTQELTQKQRVAIEMYYVRQMKMEDIARELGINVSTVSRNIKRGRERLKKCLKYGAGDLLRSETYID